ncbi:hypothetical protein PFAG_05350 [Plasmodium falciparum Santa Lucia]|uniref:Uncharacterized protein n=3 Tax=Plasmodium falciparum TaxID=5833 RepID=W7F570_PLAF8|nr:hypothetical protein PFNF135_06037 [Plasmodium falciparum NF135/5.C10]EUR63562.1 hypothetical protein PFBG_05310 [Plasmodium falciparum 7G8]EUT78773.1 hypothetical protein PFAG_05350 [Plasmodium falciparum Santa Lucia]
MTSSFFIYLLFKKNTFKVLQKNNSYDNIILELILSCYENIYIFTFLVMNREVCNDVLEKYKYYVSET